jgi:hypothetical protein
VVVIYMLGKANVLFVEAIGMPGDAIDKALKENDVLENPIDRLVNKTVAVVYETDVLGERVGMLAKAIDELGKLGGELGDERRKRVTKNVGVENDSAARVDGIGVQRNVTREVVNVTREVVKAMSVLVRESAVRVSGGCLWSEIQGEWKIAAKVRVGNGGVWLRPAYFRFRRVQSELDAPVSGSLRPPSVPDTHASEPATFASGTDFSPNNAVRRQNGWETPGRREEMGSCG